MNSELNPTEIEFIAEKELVSITPKFTQNNVIYLISVSSFIRSPLVVSRDLTLLASVTFGWCFYF